LMIDTRCLFLAEKRGLLFWKCLKMFENVVQSWEKGRAGEGNCALISWKMCENLRKELF
jgi:hypothetical protein